MGYADRDYHRHEAPRPPSRLGGAPVVKGLLAVNIVIFLLGYLRADGGGEHVFPIYEYGSFTISQGFFGFQWWRLITFQFLHADYMHLLFNMYALYMFGPILERWWRSGPFVVFYLLCGVAGALFFVLLWAVPGLLEGLSEHIPLVGASAGIFGILIGVAIIAPEGRVMLLFPPIPMKMRTFAILIMAFGAGVVLINGHNAGGEAGHLGGAMAGFLLMKVPPLRRMLMGLGRRSQIVVGSGP